MACAASAAADTRASYDCDCDCDSGFGFGLGSDFGFCFGINAGLHFNLAHNPTSFNALPVSPERRTLSQTSKVRLPPQNKHG